MKKKIALVILIVILVIIGFFSIGSPPQAEKIKWGVNFSQKYAQESGLDWQEIYSALIDDLGAKNIKLATYWDLIEREEGQYDFSDLDWQVQKAEESGVELIFVVGVKSPRWPECHIPQWAIGLTKEEQQEKILIYLKEIVSRYQASDPIKIWQVENEPFFPYGQCLWADKNFLEREVALVKSLDNKNRPVLISDSGEGSLWISAAKIGDIVGTTMYKKVWFKEFKAYISYPFSPMFYYRKADIIKRIFDKEVICVELQTEPWGAKLTYDLPIEEQEKTMSIERLRQNIEFAKKTGLKEFYLWGGEWWYWMKEKHNHPEFWQEVKNLF